MKIQELLPLLKPGFVASDAYGAWTWYRLKPDADTFYGQWLPARVGRGECMELCGFDIVPFDGDWEDSLMECGKQDVRDKVTLKTPIGDIATSVVAPNDVCIAPKIKEFSFTAELINGAKISFEGIPNNAGLTDEQAIKFLEDLFGIKETKK